MISHKRQPKEPNTDRPSLEKRLESGLIKRCGVCWREWAAEEFTEEDGQERCPTCVDERTATWKAETQRTETEYAISREPEPQISKAPLKSTFPGSIRIIKDANGNRVYQSAPLNLIRTVAKTLVLYGRDFSATDTITGSTGLTITVSSRTATQTDLSVTAGGSMTPGNYHLVFNDVYYHNLFSVR
jgi:hypothetical protein